MKCKNCKYFYKQSEIYGECEKIETYKQEPKSDMIVVDFEADDVTEPQLFVKVGYMFGCIHFEKKDAK